MDFALALAIFILGCTVGALIAHALTADRHPMNLHSGRGDVDRRSQRVDDYEPTETGVRPEYRWPRA